MEKINKLIFLALITGLAVTFVMLIFTDYMTNREYDFYITNEDYRETLKDKYNVRCLKRVLDNQCKQWSGNFNTDGLRSMTDKSYQCYSSRTITFYIDQIDLTDQCITNSEGSQ